MAHRALECYDILQQIFLEFSSSSETEFDDTVKINRDALSKSARVCKTFSFHALNVLWEALDDLSPALKVLPSFESVHLPDSNPDPEVDSEYGYKHIEYKFRDVIQPKDMERFREYAVRVRSLTFSSQLSPESRLTVLFGLMGLNHGPLFPLLRELRWSQLYISGDDSILSVLSPSLRRLDFTMGLPGANSHSGPEDTSAVRNLTTAVGSGCPSLEVLNMCGVDLPSSLVPLLNGQRYRKIQLVSPAINASICHKLAILDQLVELDVSLVREDSVISGTPGFVALQMLIVRGRLTDIRQLMENVASTSLRSIDMHLYGESDPRQWSHLLSLALSKSGPSVKKLRFFGGMARESWPRTSFMDIISPLMTSRLEDIELAFSPPFSTQDQDFVDLAGALPQLASFSLRYVMASDSLISPSVLHELARLCPKLQYLKLPPVDLQTGSLAQVSPFKSLDHKLRFLCVGYRPGRVMGSIDVPAVARFIDSIFPNLDLHDALEKYFLLYSDLIDWDLDWEEVNEDEGPEWEKVLEELQRIRGKRQVRGASVIQDVIEAQVDEHSHDEP